MSSFPFNNPDLPIEQRVQDLVSRLTSKEKAQQMLHEAPAIERLGIPAYNWWNECLHGVARAGIATVFPQAIGLAAMFDDRLLREIAEVVSDEARAKHHEYVRQGDRGMYKGLTFWTPNINIFRDPRWGRGHETYGECPYLTGRLGVAFCKGLQGDDETYLKVVATPKHFAVHSGPEGLRHSFNAVASDKDLRETYLSAFFDCVVEAKAHSVMAAYNRTNGEPCCASKSLLVDILREEWGFQGYVVSDCWAIRDFHENHKVTKTPEQSAADAVRAGCDLNCGCTYEHIPAALEQGLIDERDLDLCVSRLFRARISLGMFDPPERVPYARIPYEVNDSEEHRKLARSAAKKAMVLLKNDGVLPLRRDLDSIAVIGPNAADDQVLVANYFGIPSSPVTPLEGIRAAVSHNTKVWYAPGCKLLGNNDGGLGSSGDLSEAKGMAERADAVVLCLGLSAEIEGEQGDAGNSEAAGDKKDLNLTGLQERLLETVLDVGKPVVVVVLSGSALNLNVAEQRASGVLQAWYPGQEAGNALADVLFGDSPGGRLPITFPRSIEDVPEFTDYSMVGRTYRYLDKEPLYPFGYGLSYTRFEYGELQISAHEIDVTGSVKVSAVVKNVGEVAGDEVVQLYVSDLEASCRVPIHSLRGFRRITLSPEESTRVEFELTPRDLSLIDESGRRRLEPGRFRATLGGSQPDRRSVELTGQSPLTVEFEVIGRVVDLPY